MTCAGTSLTWMKGAPAGPFAGVYDSLRRSEARLRAAFEQSPFAVLTYRPDGSVKSANPTWYALWQSPPDVLAGYNIFDDPQVDALGLRGDLRRAFAGEAVRMPVIRYDPADIGREGRPRWIECGFYPLQDEEGRVFEVVQVTYDITEAKEAEEALNNAQEVRQLALASANMGVWELDLDTMRGRWDERARVLFGLTSSEVRDLEMIERVHPDDRPNVETVLAHAMVPCSNGFYDFEYRTCPRPGTVLWVRSVGRVLFRTSGNARQPVRIVGIMMNVTEQKEAARRKDDFLAMLSHELRNPLAAIRTAAELVQRSDGDRSILARASGVLARQSAHMAKLLDGLLDVSRITRGKVTLEKRRVKLGALLRDVVSDRRTDAAQKDVDLHLAIDEDAPMIVSADPARLIQVFDNLIGNALRFTDRNGSVTVSVELDDAKARVSVRDTGIGFAPETKARLFEPFAQGPQDLSRERGGLGLGLSLAQGLVELHGGSIEADSAGPGRGATFVVRLPLTLERLDEHPTRTTSTDGNDAARILLIEDNEDSAETLRAMLELDGHVVEVANDGEGGIELAVEQHPDVVLCDIGLPGSLSGFDVARFLRSHSDTRDIRLVAITGYGRPEDQTRCTEAGFDVHLTKPVDLATMTRAITEPLPRA